MYCSVCLAESLCTCVQDMCVCFLCWSFGVQLPVGQRIHCLRSLFLYILLYFWLLHRLLYTVCFVVRRCVFYLRFKLITFTERSNTHKIRASVYARFKCLGVIWNFPLFLPYTLYLRALLLVLCIWASTCTYKCVPVMEYTRGFICGYVLCETMKILWNTTE